MRNHETGLDYAKFDHSDVRLRQKRYQHSPDWRGVYVYLLEVRADDAAHLVRSLNDEKYRAETVFPVQGAQLRSLSEVQADRDEAEAATLGSYAPPPFHRFQSMHGTDACWHCDSDMGQHDIV